MGYEYQLLFHCISDGDLPPLRRRLVGIWERRCKRVKKDRGSIHEGYAMLLKIRCRFSSVPLKRHESECI